MKTSIKIVVGLLVLAPLCTKAQNVFPATGNVGLGTTTPAAPLDVTYTDYDARSVILGRLPEGSGSGYGTYLGVQTGFGDKNNRAFRFEHGFYGNTNGAISFYHGNSEQSGSMSLMVNWGNEAVYLDSTGLIGIGTNNPQSLLAVNGTLSAKRLKVTTSGWPDYVFHPGYPLMPLSSVADFIRLHAHLPGVPAASEVHKEGVEIAAMQKVLLQKVEELTLYLLDIYKESQALQQENEMLKKELEKLTEQ